MSKRWVGGQGGREIPVQRCRDLIHIFPVARPRFGTLNSTRRLENHQVQTKQSQVLMGASLPAMGGALKHRGSAGDVTEKKSHVASTHSCTCFKPFSQDL